MACPLGVRINRVPLYTNPRRQEKTETKDFYNPRTESRIGYNFVRRLVLLFWQQLFSVDIFPALSLFLLFYVSMPPPTGLLLVHHSIYGINQTTIPRFALTKRWRSKFETYNLFYVQVKPAKIYTLYQPSHGRKPPGRPQKSFFSWVQGCTDPRISKRLTSCALPKTEPVGDDLQSSALWSTDDVSINSLFIVSYFSVWSWRSSTYPYDRWKKKLRFTLLPTL